MKNLDWITSIIIYLGSEQVPFYQDKQMSGVFSENFLE